MARDLAGGVRCRVDISHVGPITVGLAETLETVAAELDELLCGEIRRELFGQLERVSLPVADDVLILLARTRNVSAIPVQIAQPEMRERE